jgi:hypothetical protein
LIGLFVAAVIASMANPSYGEKSFWIQLALCALGGAVSVVAQEPSAAAGMAPGATGVLASSPDRWPRTVR